MNVPTKNPRLAAPNGEYFEVGQVSRCLSIDLPAFRNEAYSEVRRMLGAITRQGPTDGPAIRETDLFAQDLSESLLVGRLAQRRRLAKRIPRPLHPEAPRKFECYLRGSYTKREEADILRFEPPSRFSDFSSSGISKSLHPATQFSDTSLATAQSTPSRSAFSWEAESAGSHVPLFRKESDAPCPTSRRQERLLGRHRQLEAKRLLQPELASRFSSNSSSSHARGNHLASHFSDAGPSGPPFSWKATSVDSRLSVRVSEEF